MGRIISMGRCPRLASWGTSRDVGDHVKMGLGYNFTEFSDDLTDLSFDHHGVFLNVTGFL